MKQPYGIFSQLDGEIKFLHASSVRFPRANRAALKAVKSYPGVFFARLNGDQPTGEHHKPHRNHISNGRTTDLTKKQIIENLPKEAIIARPRRTSQLQDHPGKLEDRPDYHTPDSETGVSLADIHVALIRRQAAREMGSPISTTKMVRKPK